MNKLITSLLIILSYSAMACTDADHLHEGVTLNEIVSMPVVASTNAPTSESESSSRVQITNNVSDAVVAPEPSVEKNQISSIDPKAIQKLLREHVPHFRYCYQKELDVTKSQESFEGIINLRFFIEKEGRAIRSEVTSKEVVFEKVQGCVKNVLQGIQFPEPKNGGTVEVNQPMNLYTKRI